MTRFTTVIFLAITAMAITSCNRGKPPLFQRIPSEKTGINFSNNIIENDSLNVIDYAYLYNGGGVGVGDFNNDDQPDLYFAGNQVSSELYLNRGEFTFEKVTENSLVGTDRWATGVSLVDINHDSWLDIYVCVASRFDSTLSRNYFFINQGIDESGVPKFTEEAEALGLADAGYSTQAAFLDYDLDGDLDLYLLTNGMEDFSHNLARPKKIQGEGISTDKLYRNDSPPGSDIAQMKFTDVSDSAGILIEGYGLGVGINDINLDGWPDIYVANDFITNDLLWINNGDGTFTDRAGEYLKHHSHNGMGTDLSDFNNDGLIDIVVLDMLPEDNYRQKTMLGKPNFDRFQLNTSYEYTPQYVRNTLQLNNGFTPQGHLSFSEIGQLAGIHNTDWSWSALFADYDNDSFRDLLITNGYVKDVTNLDFVTYLSATSQFGTQESKRSRSIELTGMLQEAKIHNYLFRNNGQDPKQSLLFSDVSKEWGMIEPSFSNGTAFADLDADGDLDLVMNNINETAFIYENTLSKQRETHNYLRINLEGPTANPQGIQTTVTMHIGTQQQYYFHSPYRGYKSTIESDIHFGLGSFSIVDSLIIRWPDGKSQRLTNVSPNQTLIISYSNATDNRDSPRPERVKPLLVEITDSLQLDWKHEESDFVDFNYQPLLHRSYSREGPPLATGDVNRDGLEDFFVGGAKFQAGSIFLQQPDGSFSQEPLSEGAESEDTDALLFDADGDQDLDLYVVSGSNEFHQGYPAYADRFYRNNGSGQFSLDTATLPTLYESGSCVSAGDFDQDGDLDLFVGGRIIPHQYPLPALSYILENQDGVFADITAEVAPSLTEIGLVTDALWTDFNQDGSIDLIVVGEWMPVTFFANLNGELVDVTDQTGLSNTTGWWTSLKAADFDQDGDTDYLAGNIGLNNKYKASEQEPIRLYVNDFDANGSIEPILTRYIQGIEQTTHSRGQLIDQLVGMRKRFTSYDQYGLTPFSELFTNAELADVKVLESVWHNNSYLENLGNGKFSITPLPIEAQFAPINDFAVEDFDNDGHLDALTVGNSYAPDTQQGWQDSSIGQLLRGNGKGNFIPTSLSESGLLVDTDAKAIVPLQATPGGTIWIISSNNDSLKIYKKTTSSRQANLALLP
ncbi:MAG: VCBS repeat-containing protein [Cyclobacteriaceae bacterium]